MKHSADLHKDSGESELCKSFHEEALCCASEGLTVFVIELWRSQKNIQITSIYLLGKQLDRRSSWKVSVWQDGLNSCYDMNKYEAEVPRISSFHLIQEPMPPHFLLSIITSFSQSNHPWQGFSLLFLWSIMMSSDQDRAEGSVIHQCIEENSNAKGFVKRLIDKQKENKKICTTS